MRHRGQPIELDDIPRDHKALRDAYVGTTPNGHQFMLQVSSTQRRVGGNTLIKNHINAQARGRPMTHADLYSDVGEAFILIGNQQRFSGYSIKGVHFGTDRAQRVVGFAVDLATKGVSLVSTNAERINRASELDAL